MLLSGIISSQYSSSTVPTVTKDSVLWLDASDTSTITSSSNSVSQINNKSTAAGAWPNFSQPVSGSRPTTGLVTKNGLNVLGFNGTSQYLNSASTVTFAANSLSIFVVTYKNTTINSSYQYMMGMFPDKYMFHGTHNNNFAAFYGNGSRWNNTNANSPNKNISSSWFITRSIQNGNNSSYWNSTAQTVKTGDAMGSGTVTVRVGAADASNQWWNGYIGEMLVYPIALSSEQQTEVLNYLNAKWNVF